MASCGALILGNSDVVFWRGHWVRKKRLLNCVCSVLCLAWFRRVSVWVFFPLGPPCRRLSPIPRLPMVGVVVSGCPLPTHAAWEGVGVRPVISPPTPRYRLDEIGSASHGDARVGLGLQGRQGELVLQLCRHTFYVAAPPDANQGQLPSAQSQVASKLPESFHRARVFSSSMAPRWQSGSHDWGGALCRVFLVTYCPC